MPNCDICSKTVYPMDPQINLDGSIYHKTCAKCDECKCQITLSNFTRSGSTLLCKTHYFKKFSETGTYLGGEKYSQKSTADNRSNSPSATVASVRRSPIPTEGRKSPAPVERRSPIPNEAKDPVELPEGGKISLKDRMKAFSSNPSTSSAAPPGSTSPQNTTIKKPTKVFGAAAGTRVVCASCEKSVYSNDPQFTIDGVTYHNQCAKCADCSCQITLANFTKSGTTLLCKTHYFKRFSEEGSYLGGDKFAQKTAKNASTSAENSGITGDEPVKATTEDEILVKPSQVAKRASFTSKTSSAAEEPVEKVAASVEQVHVTVEETPAATVTVHTTVEEELVTKETVTVATHTEEANNVGQADSASSDAGNDGTTTEPTDNNSTPGKSEIAAGDATLETEESV